MSLFHHTCFGGFCGVILCLSVQVKILGSLSGSRSGAKLCLVAVCICGDCDWREPALKIRLRGILDSACLG